VVNAVSASRRREGEPFGGGPLIEGTLDEVARAAFHLATQERRAMSHELVVTPAGDRWVP
jgi:hypothetical protein